MGRTFVWGATSAILWFVGGCGDPYYFRPADNPHLTLNGEVARYVLARKGFNAAVAYWSARGSPVDASRNGTPDRLVATVTLDNRLAQPVQIPAEAVRIRDDRGNRLPPAEGMSVQAGPGQKACGRFVFNLPGGRGIDSVCSFDLHWSSKLTDSGTKNHRTEFARSAPPTRYHEPYAFDWYDYLGPWPYPMRTTRIDVINRLTD